MNNTPTLPNPPKSIARILAWFYNRNGYVRIQNKKRIVKEGRKRYKKGDEVRLIAKSTLELRVIQSLLRKAGFKFGKPFKKSKRYCQPIYGRQEVARFLQMIEWVSDD